MVRFPDGTTLAEKTAAQTLALTIERIGFEKVSSLGILVNSENIVSKSKSETYQDVYFDPFYVKTHSNTQQKKKHLEQISDFFDLKLEVTII
ncbi:hypothetical protein CBW24_10210 [Pacificitalea manganoxidans]|uniref:Uncharacterized protein n=2 Tax=Pacificitalea manganoxidans TaxID=1411902 RepID=A0A291M051_9RHOB|nr:hypothetical protein CBW24_10210 [Pacificitalea manganoxidans]